MGTSCRRLRSIDDGCLSAVPSRSRRHRGGDNVLTARRAAVDLYWIPLGAGGRFVHLNGRAYEYFRARRERRPALNLYHTALDVVGPEGRFIIENAWPVPDSETGARGVTVEGPVWTPRLRGFRVFRYEVRRWKNGVIPDIGYAVASPLRVSTNPGQARRVLAAAEVVPAHTWGRDILHMGDMWNSNSVISWLLTSAGIDAAGIRPPEGGRVPGWITGILLAESGSATDNASSVRSIEG